MVQEFHVVRCFSCETFQVQQVKKVSRWTCKLCGEKQSLLKEFGRGSGADCRRHVQRLNAMRGAVMEEQEHSAWSLWEQAEADLEDEPEEQQDDQANTQVTQTQVSCWSKYLDTPKEVEPEEEEEENVSMDRQQLHGNRMIDRKRKRREGRTDRHGQDSWTPEQSKPPSLTMKPSASTRITSVKQTSVPSLRNNSPPRKKTIHPPSASSGPVSRWAQFLRPAGQAEEERAELAVSGRSQPANEAASLSCEDVIHQTPPLDRPCPLLPVSSMFQSGDDFDFEDEFH